MRWLRPYSALTAAIAVLITVRGSAAAAGNVWVSLESLGNQFSSASGAYSYPPSISSDGNYVAYQTLAPLAPGDDANGLSNIVLRNLDQASSILVSIASDGTQGNGPSYGPAMSADGSLVAFESLASNLVAGDENNVSDIYLRDVITSTTTRISVANDGSDANTASYRPSISADGSYVAFCSRASNLVAGDDNNVADLFLWARATGALTRVPVSGTYNGAVDGCERTAIDDDGGVVAFAALSGGQSNVYTYDRGSGTTALATPNADGSSGISGLAISGDGKLAAFDSTATNLITGDSNRSRDVFLRDLGTKKTTRVSVRSDGSQLPDDSGTSGLAISRDGHFVVFGSQATGVVPGDSNGREDVFRHEPGSGKTTIVSVSASGGSANDSSYGPATTADGSLVAFTSLAANIGSGDSNRQPDVFVRATDFPESLGNSSGPEDTGAPKDDTTLPIPSDNGAAPTAPLIAGGVAAAGLLLAGWFLLGRRGRA